MKLRHVAILLALFIPALSQAQNYSMAWSAVGGSGGTGSSGPYSVASTVGQANAGGPMSAGNYDSTVGFWEVAGGPGLTIRFVAPDTVVISWPVPELGCFALEVTSSLSPPSVWDAVPATVTFANGVDQVTTTLTGRMQYYRLVSPCQ